MLSLQEFRNGLQKQMPNGTDRPFLCSGNPLAATIFLVGLNPATSLNGSFWDYWDDETGLDRAKFLSDYRARKPIRGVRARLERIVAHLQGEPALETNIHSVATKRATDLKNEDKNCDAFRYLFDAILPKIVFLHSNGPIRFFESELNEKIPENKLHSAFWGGHNFKIYARKGPLFRAKFSEADEIGDKLRGWA